MNTERFTPAGNVIESINRLLRPKLAKLGEAEAENIRNDLSVGVVWIGDDTIRSRPGEAPRREFGQLQRSVKWNIVRGKNGVIELEISAQRDSSDGDPRVAQYLQRHLNRPFMTFSLGRLMEDAPAALKS